MDDLKIFYLRICFMLFINAEFSNAAQLDMPSPDKIFHVTSIDKLYEKRRYSVDFILHSSEKQMFLGFHDSNKLSIYETGASRTYFSFSLDEVDFESLHDQTMAFTVRERSDIRHLQCIFTANQKTLDTIYEFLSSYTTANSMRQRCKIMKVELYMGRELNATVRNFEDLQPAMLYADGVHRGLEAHHEEKVFIITPVSTRGRKPRFVFRTNRFRVKRLGDKVVLTLSGFENLFYIFYFEKEGEASFFMSTVIEFGTDPNDKDVALDVPSVVLLYLRK